MFEDRDAEVGKASLIQTSSGQAIGFASNWKTTRSVQAKDCQTEEQVRDRP